MMIVVDLEAGFLCLKYWCYENSSVRRKGINRWMKHTVRAHPFLFFFLIKFFYGGPVLDGDLLDVIG